MGVNAEIKAEIRDLYPIAEDRGRKFVKATHDTPIELLAMNSNENKRAQTINETLVSILQSPNLMSKLTVHSKENFVHEKTGAVYENDIARLATPDGSLVRVSVVIKAGDPDNDVPFIRISVGKSPNEYAPTNDKELEWDESLFFRVIDVDNDNLQLSKQQKNALILKNGTQSRLLLASDLQSEEVLFDKPSLVEQMKDLHGVRAFNLVNALDEKFGKAA